MKGEKILRKSKATDFFFSNLYIAVYSCVRLRLLVAVRRPFSSPPLATSSRVLFSGKKQKQRQLLINL